MELKMTAISNNVDPCGPICPTSPPFSDREDLCALGLVSQALTRWMGHFWDYTEATGDIDTRPFKEWM